MLRRALLLVAALAAPAACAEQVDIVDSQLATPTGLAVAGTADRPLLFIANAQEDTVQVLRLTEALDDTRFVLSEALYFPLRIPAGPRPTKLAATPDGRWVIVLSEIAESLRLIDATTLEPVLGADGAVYTLRLGPGGAQPRDMVAMPADAGCREGACGTCETSDCAGRVLVTLGARGAVLAVDVVADAAGVRLVPTATYSVGGSPQRLAVSRDRRFVYVTDAAAPEVARLRLGAGLSSVERRSLGGAGGPLAVSTDGTLLVVGRPDTLDVVLLEGAGDATFGVRPLDTVLAPEPRCLTACAPAAPQACLSQHPADAALCASDAGLASVSDATSQYEALYLGRVPSLIATLGGAAGHAALTYTCAEQARTFSEYAVVVTEGDTARGDVNWLTLRDAASGAVDVQIASRFCRGAAAEVSASADQLRTRNNLGAELPAPTLGEVVQACVEHPADRARFICASDGAGGVVLMPSGRGSSKLTFEWEAPLAGLDRPGGGQIVDGAPETFQDIRLATDAFAEVQAGDVLEVLGPFQANDPECEVGPTPRACDFERRVVAVLGDGLEPQLVLDAPLDVDCFTGNDGRIAYRVRVGDQFSVSGQRAHVGGEVYAPSAVDPATYELVYRPGARHGPGGSFDTGEPLLFRLADLAYPKDDPSTAIDERPSACARYAEAGAVLDPLVQAPVLARDRLLTFSVVDPYQPFVGGVQHNTRGDAVAGVGSMPGDILVRPTGVGDAVQVFVTYSGSDGLYGFVPNEPARVDAGFGASTVIRR